ncbi:MAG: tetratricopeptide repeat protein [Blastocatellia bacterium]|nr:tetratricopeptide repeat protein [Blastocatellia bacterium]
MKPNYATAHHFYSMHLAGDNRPEEAVREVRKALEIDPFSPIINTAAGAVFYRARLYDPAIERLRKTLESNPELINARWFLGLALEQKGDYRKAIAEYERALALAKNCSMVIAALGRAYAVSGERDMAEAILDRLRESSKHSYVSPYYVAMIYTGLGENDRAFEYLEKAYQERSLSIGYIKVDQPLDPLRTDPRFQDLLRRAGFA